MRLDSLEKHFEAIGGRVKFRRLATRLPVFRGRRPRFTIDIGTDRRGQFFDVALGTGAPEFEVLQSVPKERHLLLFTSDRRRFLCGHDERHWFVAEIGTAVSTVREAKRSLMPSRVLRRTVGLKGSEVESRHNRAFKRQGEWFFIPVGVEFDESVILRNEPLQRGARSKPHVCEELVRVGGQTVQIIGGRAYTIGEYRALVARDPGVRRRARRTMVRNPRVYVRGSVRHPDHATLKLDGWHRVMINRELMSANVTFLD